MDGKNNKFVVECDSAEVWSGKYFLLMYWCIVVMGVVCARIEEKLRFRSLPKYGPSCRSSAWLRIAALRMGRIGGTDKVQ